MERRTGLYSTVEVLILPERLYASDCRGRCHVPSVFGVVFSPLDGHQCRPRFTAITLRPCSLNRVFIQQANRARPPKRLPDEAPPLSSPRTFRPHSAPSSHLLGLPSAGRGALRPHSPRPSRIREPMVVKDHTLRQAAPRRAHPHPFLGPPRARG
jgi:hypothetical protein